MPPTQRFRLFVLMVLTPGYCPYILILVSLRFLTLSSLAPSGVPLPVSRSSSRKPYMCWKDVLCFIASARSYRTYICITANILYAVTT